MYFPNGNFRLLGMITVENINVKRFSHNLYSYEKGHIGVWKPAGIEIMFLKY